MMVNVDLGESTNISTVPLPLYDTAGKLIAPSRYKDSVAGALVPVNFSLPNWFIPASGPFEAGNTFVADIKSAKVLPVVDAVSVKALKKRRTVREELVFVSPSKKSKKDFRGINRRY